MLRTPTVCLVDDDVSVQRAVRRLLLASGYRVVSCGSAAEFLGLDDLPDPVCLVVDVRMPGMTGPDLVAALDDARRDIPVIMMSGHADSAAMVRSQGAGAVSFLCKPFESDALLDALRQAFNRVPPRSGRMPPVPIQTKA